MATTLRYGPSTARGGHGPDHRLPGGALPEAPPGLGHLKAHSSPIVNRQAAGRRSSASWSARGGGASRGAGGVAHGAVPRGGVRDSVLHLWVLLPGAALLWGTLGVGAQPFGCDEAAVGPLATVTRCGCTIST